MEKPAESKSMYDASAGEVAFKNFLAGFMRGLGGFFITLLTWAALYFFSVKYLLPQLTGVLGEAKSMIQSVEKIQTGTTNLMAPKTQAPGSEAGTSTGGLMITPELIKQVQQMQQKQ